MTVLEPQSFNKSQYFPLEHSILFLCFRKTPILIVLPPGKKNLIGVIRLEVSVCNSHHQSRAFCYSRYRKIIYFIDTARNNNT
jgi:hypothetical protein